MDIRDYNKLNDTDKENLLWEHGIFLANFNDNDLICDVYKLFNFYISLCYVLHKNERAIIISALFPDDLPFIKRERKLFDKPGP